MVIPNGPYSCIYVSMIKMLPCWRNVGALPEEETKMNYSVASQLASKNNFERSLNGPASNERVKPIDDSNLRYDGFCSRSLSDAKKNYC